MAFTDGLSTAITRFRAGLVAAAPELLPVLNSSSSIEASARHIALLTGCSHLLRTLDMELVLSGILNHVRGPYTEAKNKWGEVGGPPVTACAYALDSDEWFVNLSDGKVVRLVPSEEHGGSLVVYYGETAAILGREDAEPLALLKDVGRFGPLDTLTAEAAMSLVGLRYP